MAIKTLIVDDATFMRTILKKMLERNNFEVVGEAENGLQAVSQCKRLQPDLITMDITMPDLNGLQAVKEISHRFPNTKIIMCSALGQSTTVVEAIKLGAKDFIVKPFHEEMMIEKIKRVMGIKEEQKVLEEAEEAEEAEELEELEELEE